MRVESSRNGWSRGWKICKSSTLRPKRHTLQRRTLTGLALMNHSSDADSDVLADYVLALIRADTPDEDLKKNAMENLEDFLRDSKSWPVS